MVNKNDNESIVLAILKYVKDLLNIVKDNNVDKDIPILKDKLEKIV